MGRPRVPADSKGTLYLVAMPLGNVRDVTYRAVDVLSSVELIAAEDTRDVAPLFAAYGITARTVSYHDHNERSRSLVLLEALIAGKDVALIADAGTPLINDPGYRLVRAAIDAGISVTSVPGPCAAVTALAASGLPADRFLYAGYPPRTSAKRRAFFRELAQERATLVLYEAPHRLVESLRDALEVLGDRDACIARSLTKPHEQYQRGVISAIIGQLEREGDVRGEVTAVIAGRVRNTGPEADRADARTAVVALLADGIATRSIVHVLQRIFKMRRRDAYALLLDAQRCVTAGEEP